MRISIQPPCGVGDADQIEQASGFRARGRSTQTLMEAQRFLHLRAQPVHRVEAAGGILENHGDAPAAHAIQHGVRRAQDFLAIQPDTAANGGM